jgi:hypothetical protein
MPLSRQFEERIAGGHSIELVRIPVTRMPGPIEYSRATFVFIRPAQHLNDVGTV